MFDDNESDEELESFVQRYQPAKFSRRELTNAKVRIRNVLNREAKASQKRNEEMASYIINYAQQRVKDESTAFVQRKRKAHGVIIGVSKLSSAVLSSLDVRAPVIITNESQSPVATARTDFKTIAIGVNADVYNPEDKESLASLIYMTKGLVYHEGGHIKWTTPFEMLLELAECDHLSAAEKFKLSRAWNVLEDQRMETAMCSLSPVMGKYFTNIVLNVVLNLSDLGSNWPWIVGRTYLPSDIRQAIRDAAEERDVHRIVEGMTECVMGYRRSKSPQEMVDYVVRFSDYLDVWGSGPRNPDKHEWGHGSAVPQNGNCAMPDGIPEVPEHVIERPSPGTVKPKQEELEEKEGEEAAEEYKPSNKEEHLGKSPGATTLPSPDEERKDEIRERVKSETKQNLESVSDNEIDEFISIVNENASRSVPTDPTITNMTDEEVRRTKLVENSMMSVLESLVVQVEPTWKSHMEEGVIDPTLFRLRDPGDTNFWSGMDGEGSNGHDIAISVLIDSSISMINKMSEASISAMGIRKACDQLGIPCTLTTFNDDVYMMAEANKDVDYIRVEATGGTSIVNAMMALDDQRAGKTHHLVVILTDGEWLDVKDTRLWSQPTRSITIVGFGNNTSSYVSNKGADHWIVIEDLLELPNIVTDSLVQHFV